MAADSLSALFLCHLTWPSIAERGDQQHSCSPPGCYHPSVLVFRLDLRFSINYPRLSCCHFLISRSVLLEGKGLVCNKFHFQDGVKTCEMEGEKDRFQLCLQAQVQEKQADLWAVYSGNLAFCSFCLWVFWRQLTTAEIHTMTSCPRGPICVPLHHSAISFHET